MKTTFQTYQCNLQPNRLVYMGFFSGLFGGGKKKEEEAGAPAEGAPKCPKCGGEMTEGHVCPVAETPAEAAPETPAAAPAEEAQAEPEEAPAEPAPEAPATCPKCGGVMTEDHVCPVAETPDVPAEEAAPEASAEPEGGESTEEKTV